MCGLLYLGETMELKATIIVSSDDIPDEIKDEHEGVRVALYEHLFAECQNLFGDFYLAVERV